MCSEFQKSLRKKESAAEAKKKEKEAIDFLTEELKDGNTEKFMDNLLNALDERRHKSNPPTYEETKVNEAKEAILSVLNETLKTDEISLKIEKQLPKH